MRLDECMGYKETEKNFKEEFGNKFKERYRRRILPETYRIPMDKIKAEDGKGKEVFFLEQKIKTGNGNAYSYWMFKKDMMDHQYGMFLSDFYCEMTKNAREGREKKYFDRDVFYDEWGKSRFDGAEQFICAFAEKNKENRVMMALEENKNGLEIYYQFEDEYGLKIFKNADKETFKEKVKEETGKWGGLKRYDFKMLEEMIEKAGLESRQEVKEMAMYGYEEKEKGGDKERNLLIWEMGEKIKKIKVAEKDKEYYVLTRENGEGKEERFKFKEDFNKLSAEIFLKQFDGDKREKENKKRLKEKIKTGRS